MGPGLGGLLLQMTPRFCGGSGGSEMWDGPVMIGLLSGSCVVCVDGLVKGNGVSVLIGGCVACCVCTCNLELLYNMTLGCELDLRWCLLDMRFGQLD